MSTLNAERLYALLPAVYRIRDEQQGHPLRALVALIAQEFEALEENVDQLYDDQFIETCDEWVAPYIGDLIGYRPLHGVAAAISSPRAEVANTIGYRRRKGTAAMLEQLARDVTDWPARAVEFFEQLATTQFMNHIRLHAQVTADLRSTTKMLQQGGAFNAVAHTAEMRRPEAGSGRYNIPNVGIFLWRLQPFSLSDVPLIPDATDPTRKFRFNPLGADQPLFRLPITETQITHIAEPANVPDPINLRLMVRAVEAAADPTVPDDYGPDESVVLLRPNANPALPPVPIPTSDICVCDLRDVPGGWAHEVTLDANKISIDPRLGRVLFGSNMTGPVLATFHSGFSRPIGGGEYERSPSDVTQGVQRSASGSEALQAHLDAISGGGRLVIEDSLTYAQTPVFKVDPVVAPGTPGLEVVVTARNGARPLIVAGGKVQLQIGARGKLVLDGIVISGAELQFGSAAGDNEPRELVLRHCTLIPGLALNADGSAVAPGAPSLVVDHAFTRVTLEQCIVGPLRIDEDTTISLTDCIVDAGLPEAIAYEGTVADGPGAEMNIQDSTFIGKLHVRLMRLASDTIFFAQFAAADTWAAPLWVERKQEGCVRFCFTPNGSLLPRHFHCVPDDQHPDVLPHFTSLRYGDPGYAQLRSATDRAIREGASDGGEIGVMHPLHQPQRETNLRIRLDEYLRFGLHAGIFYVT
ncbi:MAG: hypothetical protein HY067_15495 [Betaproteobacteria bacterium]|nr:hypothetical protein [Betaproteobacteria bacterium]